MDRRTTTEPSPTPEATRLTEPERTSPTANTPGVVVAKGEASAARPASWPVTTKPLRVEVEAAAQPVGVGLGPDHDEHVADGPGLARAAAAVGPGDPRR